MFKGMLLVFIGACCYGVLSTFASITHQKGYTMGDVAGAQAFLGMIVLWLLYTLQKKKHKTTTAGPQTPAWKVILAGTSIGIATYVYYQSVTYIPASLAAILLMQFTWMSMLVEWIGFRKKPLPTQLWAMSVLLAGTILASGIIGQYTGWPDIRGVGIALLSAAIYSVYVIVNGRVGAHIPALKKSALLITGATVGIFVVAMPSFLFTGLLWSSFGWQIAGIALFSTIIPPCCFAIGIPRIGVTLSAMLMTVELPVAVVTAHLLLEEPVSSWQWAGILIMLGAMASPHLLEWRRR